MARKSTFQGTKINPTRFHRSQLKFYALLVPLAAFMLLPIVFIISHALKPIDELFAFPPRFFVTSPTLQNFVDLFRNADRADVPLTRYLFNSIVVSFAVVVSSVAFSGMAGYALSKKKFLVRKALFEINTIALMFVPLAVTIPRFLVVANLGIANTYWGHVLPLIALPVGLFLVKQFIDQIPDSLIEAARIDGAGDFSIFFRIIVPLIAPALATVAILSFQLVWNNAETSNLYVDTESMRTFAFYMTTMTSQTGNNVVGQGMAAAGAMIMFLPNLLIFIFMQGRVMNTMAHSGLK